MGHDVAHRSPPARIRCATGTHNATRRKGTAMILRNGTVELLGPHEVPAELRDVVDRVLVIGDLPCSAIATSASQPMLMAVGASRAAALRRLCSRVARRGVAQRPSAALPTSAAPQPRVSA